MNLSKEKKEFSRNFIWNALGTGFSSFNSLFFLIIVTRINGEELAGMFSIGIAIGLILYAIGLYSGRVCHVTNTNPNITDKDYVVNRSLSCALMMILAFVIVNIRGYSGIKLYIVILTCLLKCLEAFGDILYGIMQKNDFLYRAGQSLTMKSLFGLVAFFLADYITKDLVFSIIILNMINILVMLLFDIKIINKIKEGKFGSELASKKSVFGIFRNEFFVFVNSFAGIYILNSSKYTIDIYLTETLQAIFGYIIMPGTVIILFAQFILLPFLKQFKELYKNRKIKELGILSTKIKSVVVLFGIFAVSVAYLIGPEFLSFIYGVNLLDYRVHLTVIIASYTLYSVSYINLIILTTMRKTFIQFVIYVISMINAFVSSNLLVKDYGILGAVASIALTLTVQFVLYIIITKMILIKLKKNTEIEE